MYNIHFPHINPANLQASVAVEIEPIVLSTKALAPSASSPNFFLATRARDLVMRAVAPSRMFWSRSTSVTLCPVCAAT